MQDRVEARRDAAPVAAVLRGVTWSGHNVSTINSRLNDVRLILHDGEQVALLGKPGSGRRALLNLLNGGLRGWNGTAIVLGQALSRKANPPRRHRRRVAFLPSRPVIDPRQSVWSNVMLGRLGHMPVLASLLGQSRPRDRAVVAQSIADLGLRPLANRLAGSLDVNTQRRIAFARALAQEPQLMLVDEVHPQGGEEPRRIAGEQSALVSTLASQRQIPLVYACPFADLALSNADRVVLMRAGGVAFSNPVRTLSAQQRADLIRLGGDETAALGTSGLRLVV